MLHKRGPIRLASQEIRVARAIHRERDGGRTGVHGSEEVGGSDFPGVDLAQTAGDGDARGRPVELLAAAAAVGEFGSGGLEKMGKIPSTPRSI